MRDTLKSTLRTNGLFWGYTLVFLLVVYGVFEVNKSKYMGNLALYFAVFTSAYWFFFLLLKKLNLKSSLFQLPTVFLKLINPISLILISVVGIIVHFIFIHGFPAIQALGVLKLSEVVKLRASITESVPSWVNYMFSWNLKAIIPFTLVMLFLKGDKKWYWIYYFISITYAFLLMQKSFILLVLAPVGILALFEKKWLYVLKFGFSSIVIVFFLTYIQNVTMRGGINDIQLEYEKETQSAGSIVMNIFLGLKERVAVTPGRIVTKWFDHIPKDKPFLKGNGFKIYTKLTGGEFHDYTEELYPLVYKENAKHGLKGTVNVAGFMRGYANFGLLGLALAALGLAFYLVIIEYVFKEQTLIKFALNIFPLVMLSSSSLLTIIFSGGWLLTIVLFVVFRHLLSVKTSIPKTL
ncbi:MAG: hypothetical protein RL110_1056 [Bacteroidota bacterium]